ncbi:MAG: Ribbon-helix-helix protein copG family [Moraxellaceae bacterium]|jgi:predicted transcriptional regulator|nr:Ribbon-helix-helix protein copG family [Moraxellaceae bacterium]
MSVNSVRLGPEIEQRLNELAIRQQRSKSDLIRQALGEYFERQAREASRWPEAVPAPRVSQAA